MRASGANPDAEWVYMPILKVAGVPHQKNYAIGLKPAFAITTEARDPGRILEWYNWTGTPEGRRYSEFGIEGVNYVIRNGRIITDDDSVIPVFIKHLYVFSWCGYSYSRDYFSSLPFGDIVANVYDAAKDDYRFIDNMMMPKSVYEGYEDYIPLKSPAYKEFSTRFVLGQIEMSEWDAYVNKWHADGGSEVVKRATAWYKNVHNIQ